MTSPPSLPAISLYQTLLAAKPPLTSMHLSAKGFRMLLRGVFQGLRHRQLEASLWIKVPNRPIWQDLLADQVQQSTAPLQIYQFERLQPPMVAAEKGWHNGHAATKACVLPGQRLAQDWDDAALIDDDGMISTTGLTTSRTVTVPLVSGQHLGREYFVMVNSAEFAGIFLAHRPRSVHAQSEAEGGGDSDLDDEGLPSLLHGDRRSRLLTLCSFRPELLQATLAQLHRVIQTSVTHQPHPSADLLMLLQTWPEQVARCQSANQNWDTIGDFFSHQVLQHEILVNQMSRHDRSAQQVQHVELENEKLRQTIQLKVNFLNRTSEELTSPITTMKTALKLLSASQLTDQQRQRYVTMLSQACDRQASVLTGVVELIQLEQIDPDQASQSIYLHDAIPGIVSTYQPLATERGISLAYTVPDILPPIRCPAMWLQHIVMHLLQNSLHFTPSGGRVWVTAHADTQATPPTVGFMVRDTGSGISPGDLPRVFDAFYQGRHSAVGGDAELGAGLGLTAVQQLLARCNGSVSLKSELGRGTIITVTLPALTTTPRSLQVSDPGR